MGGSRQAGDFAVIVFQIVTLYCEHIWNFSLGVCTYAERILISNLFKNKVIQKECLTVGRVIILIFQNIIKDIVFFVTFWCI